MARIVGWLGVAAGSLYLVFFGGSWYGLYATELRVASVAIAGITILAWASVAARKPAWRVRSHLLPALVLVILSLTASTLASRYPRQSVEYLGYAIILVALYLLLVRILASAFLRRRMGVLAVAVCLVLTVAYLGRTGILWLQYWDAVGRITIPPLRPAFESLVYGDPASMMTIVVLLFATSVAFLWPTTRRGWAGLAASGVLVALAVLVSGSRSGWVGVAVACVATAILYLRSSSSIGQLLNAAREIGRSLPGRVAVAVGVVGSSALALVLGPGVLARLSAGGEDLRAAYVAASLRMFQDAPILGTGPGSWVIQRVRYTISPEVDYYIPHAHNIYAQTLAELGLVGAVVGIAVVAWVIALVRQALRGADPTRRRMGWAAVFVLAYLAVQQVLDFHANMPSILFVAVLPIAWLDATSAAPVGRWKPSPPSGLHSAAGLAGLAVVLVACGGLLASERVALIETDAVNLANEGRWDEALAPAREAARQDPSWPTYQVTLGLAAAHAGDHVTAANAFRFAALTDDLPESWLNLAAEEALLGDRAAALDALDRAARLGLQRPGVAMAIGDLALRLEDAALAEAGFSAALRELPLLAGDPWWTQDPVRAAAFRNALTAAIEESSEGVRWQLALAAGDAPRARELASAAPSEPSATDIIDASLGDVAAGERLFKTCARTPANTFAIDWCARISAKRGDVTSANRYRTQSFLLLDDPGGPLTPRVSPVAIVGRAEQGEIAAFYGAYTYRRFTPWNLMDPSLVQLEFE